MCKVPYFTFCSLRCENTMNHKQENVAHEVKKRCRFQHQYENKIYLCKVNTNEIIYSFLKTSATLYLLAKFCLF